MRIRGEAIYLCYTMRLLPIKIGSWIVSIFPLFIHFVALHTQAQQLIPAPVESRGNSTIQAAALRQVYTTNKELLDEINTYIQFKKQLKLPEVRFSETNTPRILCQINKKANKEAYQLDAMNDGSVRIMGSEAGVFYGLMSLLQLECQQRNAPTLTLPQVDDQPAFSWRGMHLDVSRHFFPVSFIKKYIDLLAMYKFNTFHWHLTDDQGWRIEIKKYPALTQIGAKRKETMVGKYFEPYVGDNMPVNGFYTQEEIKDVVRYAQQRHINIVPEIEMPGHALAALTAYPQYACQKNAKEVMTKWGVSDDVFCCNDSTLRFLKNILTEVMDLFPSPFIHIGGDEVPKTRWKACSTCQRIITKNKLKDEHELQSYFIRKIDAFITSKGRKTIGWDEILEGGLAPGAAVMSWRGVDGGIAAAKQKHQVVMSPGTHCYFDHYQGNVHQEPLAIGGYTPIEKVYAYDPIPASLTKEEAVYILGAQANVWTEYIPNSNHAEYMAFPRALALSEVLWTGKQRPGFDDFKERLRSHFSMLDTLKVQYSPSVFQVQSTHEIVNDRLMVKFFTHYNKGNIITQQIEKDGSVANNQVYVNTNGLLLDKTAVCQAYYQEPGGFRGPTFEETYAVHKALGKSLSAKTPPSTYYNTGGLATLVDGLRARAPRDNRQWLAWHNEDVQLTIDLSSEQLINNVSLSMHDEIQSQIFLPEKIQIEIGTDGNDFSVVKELNRQDIKTNFETQQLLRFPFDNTVFGRQVRVTLFYDRKAPVKPWMFISEVEVD